MHYAELHCKTNFSFLEGASHAEELVRRAAELGYRALAVTDRSSLAGVVRAHIVAKEVGLPLVVGAEVTPADALPVVLWATDRTSYGRLCRLLTRGRRQAPKGECALTLDDVAEFAEGLIAGVMLQPPALPGVLKASRETELPRATEVLPCTKPPAEPGAVLSIANGSRQPTADSRQPPALEERRGARSEKQEQGGRRNAEGGKERLDGAFDSSFPPPPSTLPSGSRPSTLDSRIFSYREIFGDRCYLLAELHRGADDAARLAALQSLARRAGIPLVAAGDVHYHVPARMVLHDVLTAIRHGTTVAAAEGTLLFPNAERHLRPVEEIRTLFAAAPEAVARTIEITDRCRFSLDELRYEYPTELVEKGVRTIFSAGPSSKTACEGEKIVLTPFYGTPLEYLTQLTWQGAAERYSAGVPQKVAQQLAHELELIGELRYEAYFLTVWDLVRFARSRNILCQGRGSAANSAVCFCLGVTSVDPATSDLLFERFVSRERNEAPDIDVDFEHERREEVLQYLYNKYGRERAGLAATVITYCSRSAIRDVGKALGLSLDRVDALAKHVEGYTREPKLVGRAREVGIDPASELGRRLVYCVNEIIGFPRHLSQHVGGMVMTQGPLCEMVPIENAAMEDRTVIEWDKDDLDELGILKVDCLCLGMLTAIHKCFDLVREHHDRALTLATIPPDDAAVYDMICRADTIGVFQIESRAQMSMLPRLRPRSFYDLVIEVAIVRPGPIQGNMVHPYLRRRAGEEAEAYPNDAIRQVLEKTLGVPIFQEQAMRLAVVAAGFTPGEADQLRRAMAAWRRPGLIDQFRQKLLEGMRANGLPEEFAQRVYRQIEGFGEYGFPESHAASFALLVYASAWLKHYYPAAFAAAMLNSQPLGFYAPAQLVRDARDHGVVVRPVDVNHSRWDCTLERGAGDWGLGAGMLQAARSEKSRESRVEGREPETKVDGGGGNGESNTSSLSQNPLPLGEGRVRASKLWAQESDSWPFACVGISSSSNIQCPPSALRLPTSSSRSSPLTPQPPVPSPQSPAPFLRLGLRMIHGLAEAAGRTIEQTRGSGPFVSIDDFARRTGLGQAVIKRLADADAFGSLGAGRRHALWHALWQEKKRRVMPLFESHPLPASSESLALPLREGRGEGKTAQALREKGVRTICDAESGNEAALPQDKNSSDPFFVPMPLYDEVVADYRTAGLSLRAHPMSFYREQLARLGITPARQLTELANGAPVRVAGLVLLRQRPGTAKGITFVTLEDETGTVNLVVHQRTWDRYYRIARSAPAWIAHGHVQTTREKSFAAVIHVVVSRLETLGDGLRQLDVKSRDFR